MQRAGFQTRRVFTYDRNGNLLMIFGGKSDQKGASVDAVALDTVNEQVLVLDRELGRITVYEPTEYADDSNSNRPVQHRRL